MLRTFLALALLGAAVGLATAAQAAPGATTAKPSIRLLGTSVSGGVVTVKVAITGWAMYPKLVGKKLNKPDGGHWHVYVNGKYNNFSANPTVGKTTTLKPGTYKIRVELANDDHSEVERAAPSRTVTVKVLSSSPPPPAPPPPPPPPSPPPYPY